MELKTLTPELAVAAQIHAPDLHEVFNAGFRTLICNRPDGEGNDQPVFAELQAAASGMGITMHYLPAESGKVTDEQGRQFGALMDASPKPVLAFCRTGMRSTTMWAL
ncbi:MAG TPA: TIGR01244 family sulfur transferase, partial [Roseateles sp.]|nr:TIGR01244 family sulfur transferase [Roseateles sp.]